MGDSYEGIGWSMKRAYLRVVMSHGGKEAFESILQRLPLSPQDHHVIALASEVAGWSEHFLERPKAKGRAMAKSNQPQGQGVDIGLALMSAAARPKAAPMPPPPEQSHLIHRLRLWLVLGLQHLWWLLLGLQHLCL